MGQSPSTSKPETTTDAAAGVVDAKLEQKTDDSDDKVMLTGIKDGHQFVGTKLEKKMDVDGIQFRDIRFQQDHHPMMVTGIEDGHRSDQVLTRPLSVDGAVETLITKLENMQIRYGDDHQFNQIPRLVCVDYHGKELEVPASDVNVMVTRAKDGHRLLATMLEKKMDVEDGVKVTGIEDGHEVSARPSSIDGDVEALGIMLEEKMDGVGMQIQCGDDHECNQIPVLDGVDYLSKELEVPASGFTPDAVDIEWGDRQWGEKPAWWDKEVKSTGWGDEERSENVMPVLSKADTYQDVKYPERSGKAMPIPSKEGVKHPERFGKVMPGPSKEGVKHSERFNKVMPAPSKEGVKHPERFNNVMPRPSKDGVCEGVKYPERSGQQDCLFYVNSGLCKFGVNCKFNHPAIRRRQPKAKPNKPWQPIQVRSYDVPMVSNTKAPVLDLPTTFHSPPAVAVEAETCPHSENPNKERNAGSRRSRIYLRPEVTVNHVAMPSKEGRNETFCFPLSPHKSDCSYYLKGNCHFGSNCKFNHPSRRNGSKVIPKDQSEHTQVPSIPTSTTYDVDSHGTELEKKIDGGGKRIQCGDSGCWGITSDAVTPREAEDDHEIDHVLPRSPSTDDAVLSTKLEKMDGVVTHFHCQDARCQGVIPTGTEDDHECDQIPPVMSSISDAVELLGVKLEQKPKRADMQIGGLGCSKTPTGLDGAVQTVGWGEGSKSNKVMPLVTLAVESLSTVFEQKVNLAGVQDSGSGTGVNCTEQDDDEDRSEKALSTRDDVDSLSKELDVPALKHKSNAVDIDWGDRRWGVKPTWWDKEVKPTGWQDEEGSEKIMSVPSNDGICEGVKHAEIFDKVPPTPSNEGVCEGVKLPERPDRPDCSFYVRSGNCKFGWNCKFNHPAIRSKQPKRNSRQYPKPGGNTYGNTSKHAHFPQKTEPDPVELNFLGLPMRPGARECTNYMHTGVCKFPSTCPYHHPNPVPVTAQDTLSGYHNAAPPQQHVSETPLLPVTSLPLPIPSCGPYPYPSPPYAPGLHPLPPQGLHPYPGCTGSQVPTSPWFPPEMIPANGYASNQASVYVTTQSQIDQFPERPGLPVCHSYMKYGPNDRAPASVSR